MPTPTCLSRSESPPSEFDRQLLAMPARPRGHGCEQSPSRWSRTITAEGRDGHRRPAPRAGSVSPRFRPVQLHLADGRHGPQHRSGRRLSGQPQAGPLRILRQCAGAVAPLRRHPVPHGQRLQGGRLERLTETLNVRQKHAHSWVEAYAGVHDREQVPIWITLDPTPAAERQESIAQVGGLAGNFRPLTDLSAISGSSTSSASTANARIACSTRRCAR